MRQTAKFDYYYGTQADAYSFYRIPKVLFTNEFFKGLSCEAKVLYGLMLDRMSLSIKNRWFDDDGRVYIMFSIDDVMEFLGCYKQKAVKLVHELDQEHGIGLIEKKRIGFGKANTFYVKNFILQDEPEPELPQHTPENDGCDSSANVNKPSETDFSGKRGKSVSGPGMRGPESEENSQYFENRNSRSSEIEIQEVRKSKFKKFENQTTDGSKIKIQEVRKSNPNYNNTSNTDLSETESNLYKNESNLSGQERMQQNRGREEMEDRAAYEDLIMDNIGFSALCGEYGLERATGVLDLLVDTVCTKKSKIIISGEPKSIEIVKNRFLKLEHGHVQYVLNCLDKNTTKVWNIRQYMLAAFYNASSTMDMYYTAEVNHAMYGSDD